MSGDAPTTRHERFLPIASSRALYDAIHPLRPGALVGGARFRRLAFDPARRSWWLELVAAPGGSPLPALYLEPLRPGGAYVAQTRTLGLYHLGSASPPVLHDVARRVAAWIAANEVAASPEAWAAGLADLAGGVLVAAGDSIDVRLTRACNEACPMCNSTGALDNLVTDRQRLRATLPQLSGLGVTSIVYTGGEPTLVPWLPEAVEEAHDAGLREVGVQTNALRFAEPGQVARFTGARRPDRWLVSLHAHRRETYEAIVGCADTFDRAVEGIHALCRAGHAVGLNHVLQAANARDVEAFVAFCAAEFGPAVSLLFCVVAPLGRQREHPADLPRYAELVPGLERALAKAETLGLATQVAELCGLPRCVLAGAPRVLAATACHEPGYADLKTWLPGCDRCHHRTACSGLWPEYLEVHGTAEFVPVVDAAKASK